MSDFSSGHEIEDLRELRGIREKHHAEESLVRFRSEAGSKHAEHACRAQQTEHVILVGQPRRERDTRHGVERGRRGDRGREHRDGLHRVRLGPYRNSDEATAIGEKVRRSLGVAPVLVIR